MLKTKACTAYQRQMQPSPSQTLWSMPTKGIAFSDKRRRAGTKQRMANDLPEAGATAAGSSSSACFSAGSRWRRASASAGARNLKGQRHLALLGPRRRGEQAEINVRCTERPPEPRLRAPHPPFTPHARIPHIPTALHASLQPHPFLPLCVRRRSMLPFYLNQGRGRSKRRVFIVEKSWHGGEPCRFYGAAPVGSSSSAAGSLVSRCCYLWAKNGHRTVIAFVSSIVTCFLELEIAQ